jgi:hypothetical protein
MTTIQIELPDSTVDEARAAGLLTSEVIDNLLTDALQRRRAADRLFAIADQVEDFGIEPMSMDEITAEVKAYRAERRLKNASGT